MLNSNGAEGPWSHWDRILTSLDLSAGIRLTNHMGRSSPNDAEYWYMSLPRATGKWVSTGNLYQSVCVCFFFPSLHSRVYPEWFNYNFPCVRQIKEESRSVVPSTLFISLTDCSSPNPRAAAAVPAPRSPKDAGGRRRGEEPSTSREIRLCKANRASHNATSGPRNRHTRVLPTPFGKNS